MKKYIWLFMLVTIVFISGCSEKGEAVRETEDKSVQENKEEPVVEKQEESTEGTKEEVQNEPEKEQQTEGTPPTALEAANTLIKALENKDLSTFANWVHREKGVRFSPYSYVDTASDLVFAQEEINGFLTDTNKKVWRKFPGSDSELELTNAEYYEQFVYNADFKNAKVSLNQVSGEETSIQNLLEVYPADNHNFVDFYVEDSSADGRNWASLRLVFEKIGDDHILVGIIHDSWTP